MPLPDGQTMVTFVDVTDSVRIERALTERAEALEAADALKNAFIHHVSYELRSPLTNIIGFTQLLADPSVGPLTDRQREYTGYVMSSSTALLAIVNDILDLATIDAGIMELDYAESTSPRPSPPRSKACRTALADADIRIATDIAEGTGSLFADSRRVRQVLFNLLVNAISFSPKGGRVELVAAPRRRDDRVRGQRQRPRHPARLHRLGLRPLRQPPARPDPRRRRPRPRHRQELRRAAWRHGRDPLRRGQRLAGRGAAADPAGHHRAAAE